jgi:hypothetical protein
MIDGKRMSDRSRSGRSQCQTQIDLTEKETEFSQ